MKNIIQIIALAVWATLFFPACEEGNELIFTAIPSEEGVSFYNTFSNNYLLSAEAEDNLAERFVWNAADFDVPVNVNYDLQASISPTLTAFDVIGTTTETNLSVTIGQLLDYAEDLDLDNDPATTDANGNPNNTGTVYFRVRAYAGAGTGNNTEMLSEIVGLNIELIEAAGNTGCDGLFALGDALVDAQWDWNTAIDVPCDANILQVKVNLTNGTFRFFETENDWASGLNYPYFVGEGYNIDAALQDAQDGDNNFEFTGTPGIYTITIDQNAKVITLEESGPLWILGDATPDNWTWGAATQAVENTPNIWTATLAFNTGTFRFFEIENDWASGLNYPYFTGEGFTIDPNLEDALDGDNNFRFTGTSGTYTITVNAIDKTITLN